MAVGGGPAAMVNANAAGGGEGDIARILDLI